MNILVLGHHPEEEAFKEPLEEAGVGIAHWDGESPFPPPPGGASGYDWLVLLDPASPRTFAQISALRAQGISAPTLCIDLEIEKSLAIFRPVLVGAVERKGHEEKILNCTLAVGSAPHPAKSNPFGEIIYEYHAPCRA